MTWSVIFSQIKAMSDRMVENQRLLAKAFKAQCEEQWEESWELLQRSWEHIQHLIALADSQPQIQQVLTLHREILPNFILQNMDNTKGEVFVQSEDRRRPTRIAKRKKNFWTEEENMRLAQALGTFGPRDFKNIEEYVGTRSVAQIRSKLQKIENKKARMSTQ